jgi:hypothetical protein
VSLLHAFQHVEPVFSFFHVCVSVDDGIPLPVWACGRVEACKRCRPCVQLVKLLLEKCQADGVVWEDPSRYGDSWTPLMCCVVGNRVQLAETLLTAAGPRMPSLISARNWHGQTALHLAAYRGASDMIKLLMRVGEELGGDFSKGGGVVRARDAAGLTPAQVARKHSQCAAEALLLRRIGGEA